MLRRLLPLFALACAAGCAPGNAAAPNASPSAVTSAAPGAGTSPTRPADNGVKVASVDLKIDGKAIVVDLATVVDRNKNTFGFTIDKLKPRVKDSWTVTVGISGGPKSPADPTFTTADVTDKSLSLATYPGADVIGYATPFSTKEFVQELTFADGFATYVGKGPLGKVSGRGAANTIAVEITITGIPLR